MIFDQVHEIWNSVFPQRVIEFKDARVFAKANGIDEYKGKYMSDGERVAIYLIGQCLIAPEGTTIIIDEPEIHLHESIMNRLWNEIEKFCQDKTLIYITHNLRFASSRNGATKIWVKSFDGNEKWEYSILEPNDDIPNELMFEVLGNRKPVLLLKAMKVAMMSNCTNMFMRIIM